MTASPHPTVVHVEWIPIGLRLPDDRRNVMVWGIQDSMWPTSPKPRYLGITKFNNTRAGGQFDIERRFGGHYLLPIYFHVTHWAEMIEGPSS